MRVSSFIVVIILVSLTPLQIFGASIVSPDEVANFRLVSPFLIQTSQGASYRFQEVHSSADFFSISSPISITEIAYMKGAGSAPIDILLENFSIRLSTTSHPRSPKWPLQRQYRSR
jgi:hypothetical protein